MAEAWKSRRVRFAKGLAIRVPSAVAVHSCSAGSGQAEATRRSAYRALGHARPVLCPRAAVLF